MKNRLSVSQIIYVALALGVLGSFAYTQTHGLRLLNVFSGGISSHVGSDGPEHK